MIPCGDCVSVLEDSACIRSGTKHERLDKRSLGWRPVEHEEPLEGVEDDVHGCIRSVLTEVQSEEECWRGGAKMSMFRGRNC